MNDNLQKNENLFKLIEDIQKVLIKNQEIKNNV